MSSGRDSLWLARLDAVWVASSCRRDHRLHPPKRWGTIFSLASAETGGPVLAKGGREVRKGEPYRFLENAH